MTYREKLNAPVRKAGFAIYGGFALFAVFGLLFTDYFFIGLMGFLTMFLGIAWMATQLGCPKCKENLGRAFIQYGHAFSVPKKIRFCHFCGLAFDSECGQPSP